MNEKDIILKLKGLLDPARFRHSLRVRKTILLLSRSHKVDLKKASIAGLLHDVSRYMDRPELLRFAKKIKMKIDPISGFEPKLLHADLSAFIARERFGIKDKQVLQAIKRHTLGGTNMTILDKIVYVADHIEEGRTHAGAKKARRLAKRDLDKAIIEISGSMASYLLDKKLPVHPTTIEVRNYYLLKK